MSIKGASQAQQPLYKTSPPHASAHSNARRQATFSQLLPASLFPVLLASAGVTAPLSRGALAAPSRIFAGSVARGVSASLMAPPTGGFDGSSDVADSSRVSASCALPSGRLEGAFASLSCACVLLFASSAVEQPHTEHASPRAPTLARSQGWISSARLRLARIDGRDATLDWSGAWIGRDIESRTYHGSDQRAASGLDSTG